MISGGMGGMRQWGRSGLDSEQEGDRIYDHVVIVRLMEYVKPYWPKVLITFITILAYTGTIMAIPWLVQMIIGDYISNQDLSTPEILSGLDRLVAVYVVIAVIQYITNYTHLRIMAFVSQQILYSLRFDLFKHLQRMSMSFYDRNEVGSVMSRIQNDVQQLQEFVSIVIVTFGDILALAGIVGVMLYMDVGLASITLSVVPLLFVTLIIWQKFARQAFVRVRKTVASVNSGLQENISGVRVVQSMSREQTNIRRFGRANYDSLDANLQAGRFSAALIPSVEVLTALSLALVVYFGGIMVETPSDVGVLVAFALFIQRFFDPVRNLTMQYGQLQRAMVSGSRIFQLLDIKPDIRSKEGASKLVDFSGNVRFEGVGFHYRSGSEVLTDVNLNIDAGETVALVGPTGAGKTTIVSLMMRLYDATDGRILFDGMDIRDIDLESVSDFVSFVPQEPFLFSSSIEDNIRYNRKDIQRDQVVRAAELVGAHDFISNLDTGYDTHVSERGVNLSLGQRQLICFARALVAKPKVLILDEATANIDTPTEILIQRGLNELLRGRTAVIIAHRLSTIRSSDRIIVIDNGTIVETGKHEYLVDKGGLYSKLSNYS